MCLVCVCVCMYVSCVCVCVYVGRSERKGESSILRRFDRQLMPGRSVVSFVCFTLLCTIRCPVPAVPRSSAFSSRFCFPFLFRFFFPPVQYTEKRDQRATTLRLYGETLRVGRGLVWWATGCSSEGEERSCVTMTSERARI